jgi:predicted O-methyltransferase YrrM
LLIEIVELSNQQSANQQPMDSAKDSLQERWMAVDMYVDGLLVDEDAILTGALEASRAAGLPGINVSAAQGKLLHLLARTLRARRILEIGTLGGYSTIWLARALPPGGQLTTIEADPAHADVAARNVAAAHLSAVVDLRIGRALDVLPAIAREGGAPFDLTFIDADKPSTTEYFEWALRLGRPGGVIVADNVVRNGAVCDVASGDAAVRGMRRFLDAVAAEPRVSATVVQTVGSKGYDGFAFIAITD